jgi:hypothetical protein
MDGVSKNDFLVEKIRVELDNGETAIYCLYGAEELRGRYCYGALFDLEGFVGKKPIRECSFMEYLKLYGQTILDGIDIV